MAIPSFIQVFLRIAGTIICGNNVILSQGCIISISKNATLSIGNNIRANANVKIHSKEKITIEDNCRFGWESQILDTSFHYTLDNGKIAYRNSPIYIGHNAWIANGVSIMKGTKLSPYTVIAAKSYVSKDLTEYGEKCMFAGTPAKLVKTGIERLLIKENKLDDCFCNDRK